MQLEEIGRNVHEEMRVTVAKVQGVSEGADLQFQTVVVYLRRPVCENVFYRDVVHRTTQTP